MGKILLIFLMGMLHLSPTERVSESSILKGKITDETTGENLIGAGLILKQNEVDILFATTNSEGNYLIENIKPGNYDLTVSYLGYNTKIIQGITLIPDSCLIVDVNLSELKLECESINVSYKKPLFNRNQKKPSPENQGIKTAPTRSIHELSSLSSGVTGESPVIKGHRQDGTIYYIDGIRVRTQPGVPQDATSQIEVIPGGVPAEYENETKAENKISIIHKKTEIRIPEKHLPLTFNTDEYDPIVENKFLGVKENPLSTFSIDVDKASYSNVRNYLSAGLLPPAGSVRIEEFINYFTYNYPGPEGKDPFNIFSEMAACPWNTENLLLKVGIQGKRISEEDLPRSNFVFLIDVSGSMDMENKLPLVKRTLEVLVKRLKNEDRVAIVVYAGAAGVVLESTPGFKKEFILNAINNLSAGGSTAGGAGIYLAYSIAEKNFIKGGNNRVILATDGDFNVGLSSDAELVNLIEKKRNSGVFLTALGFGMGNYKDNKLEKLASHGNGNYAYIDDYSEATKVLGREMSGTLYTIAKDVKIQIEFNPAVIKGYRLIGYENRILAKEDFNDDSRDAGELGAGHTVTALYELIPTGSRSIELPLVDDLRYESTPEKNEKLFPEEAGLIKLRYKEPDGEKSTLMTQIVKMDPRDIYKTSENLRFAASVALFAMLLRNSEYAGSGDFAMVRKIARGTLSPDEEGYKHEFIHLVSLAKNLK